MEALSFDGSYVDGDRERPPYEADSYIHQMSSYGVDNEFTTARCTFEYLTNHMSWPTEWKFHLIFVAWADYQQTGDPYLMTKYYGFLTNNCMLATAAPGLDGLVQSYAGNRHVHGLAGDIIDWSRISGDGIGNIDGYVAGATNAVINAFYYRCLTIMTNVAQLTGHSADAANFAARAGQVYSNYNNKFWNSGSQSYIDGEGTTHSSADATFFPLAFGLVPATNQAATDQLFSFADRCPGRHAGGRLWSAVHAGRDVFGRRCGCRADGDDRQHDAQLDGHDQYRLHDHVTRPGAPADNLKRRLNHAWGAAPGNLISRYVLGVRPLAAGYGQILIQPQLARLLTYAQGTVPMIRGPGNSSGEQRTGSNSCQMLLQPFPGNVTATVMLPATNIWANSGWGQGFVGRFPRTALPTPG